MKNFLFLMCLAVVLAGSCSKKKEEAAKLEQEMLGQETTAVDTTAMPVDTVEPATPEVDAGAIPEEEPAYMPRHVEQPGYVVQVAACESMEYAQYLVEKYQNRGYDPYMITATVEGQTYYRVRIGGIETEQEAKQLKNELLDKYSIQAWIDEIQ